MKKYGGFIPGIRAGRPTAEYLDYVLTDHGARCDLPRRDLLIPLIALVAVGANQNFPFGGTVDPHHRRRRPETVKQIQAQLQQSQYEGSSVKRLIIMGPPARARGRQPSASPSGSGPGILDRRPFPPPTSRRHRPRQAGRVDPQVRRLRARRDDQAVVQAGSAGSTRPGFLLDGYPRTPARSTSSTRCSRPRPPLDGVIELTVDGTRWSRACSTGRDRGSRRRHRRGHRERQAIYHTQTAPLIAIYQEHGILVR